MPRDNKKDANHLKNNRGLFKRLGRLFNFTTPPKDPKGWAEHLGRRRKYKQLAKFITSRNYDEIDDYWTKRDEAVSVLYNAKESAIPFLEKEIFRQLNDNNTSIGVDDLCRALMGIGKVSSSAKGRVVKIFERVVENPQGLAASSFFLDIKNYIHEYNLMIRLIVAEEMNKK